MRRSGFTPKPTWKRLQRSKSINKVGPKTKAWNGTRADLKVQFEHQFGVTTCEFTFPHNCWHSEGLSFAHSCKRNDPLFNMTEVALACPHAHQILDEVMSHEEMRQAVQKVIQNRSQVL